MIASAQTGNKMDKNNINLLANDSILSQLKNLEDSTKKAFAVIDSLQIQESITRNTDTILQFQKERNAKQKKAAMIRIGIGVAFLIVLVIGLTRRKGKK